MSNELNVWDEFYVHFYNTNEAMKYKVCSIENGKVYAGKYWSDPVFNESQCLKELIPGYTVLRDYTDFNFQK